jgi:hypothetical protein
MLCIRLPLVTKVIKGRGPCVIMMFSDEDSEIFALIVLGPKQLRNLVNRNFLSHYILSWVFRLHMPSSDIAMVKYEYFSYPLPHPLWAKVHNLMLMGLIADGISAKKL